jgi:hypothetical protein
MTETGGALSFDRAAYASPDGGPPCANCKRPLGDEYWKWQSNAICTECKGRVESTLAKSKSGKAFGKAVLLGGGTALGCGIAYAVFVAATQMQIAFATIGIAFLVARVIRKASAGVGGRRFQVLAVALTYVASAMGYLPPIVKGIQRSAEQHQQAEAKSAPADGAPSAKPASSPLGVVVALAFLAGLTLAAPFLELTEAPIGLLIVLFGLWEAWKLSRGVPLVVEGPYRTAPAATGPPA